MKKDFKYKDLRPCDVRQMTIKNKTKILAHESLYFSPFVQLCSNRHRTQAQQPILYNPKTKRQNERMPQTVTRANEPEIAKIESQDKKSREVEQVSMSLELGLRSPTLLKPYF
ncbi:MAG: hypothetical protein JNL70_27840 [Saprospiraceae bacterium]|nr:hypothetical protein [Saprospiraceae bacterium]